MNLAIPTTAGEYTSETVDGMTTITFTDGIFIDYTADEAIVWSADGAYDAHYKADDLAGISNEIKFRRVMENGLTVISGTW